MPHDQVQASQVGAPHAQVVGECPVAVFIGALQLGERIGDRVFHSVAGHDPPPVFDNQAYSSSYRD
jgi:hypothetical protein